jgi:hypothetical protein
LIEKIITPHSCAGIFIIRHRPIKKSEVLPPVLPKSFLPRDAAAGVWLKKRPGFGDDTFSTCPIVLYIF